MEESPIHPVDQDRVGSTTNFAELVERIELIRHILLLFLKATVETDHLVRVCRVDHVRSIVMDKPQPVLLMPVIDHRLSVVVAVQRIESSDVVEMLIQEEHPLMRVALERDKSTAA